jgi:hypothetical protein
VAFEWICLAAVHESARGHLADLASGRPFCPVSGGEAGKHRGAWLGSPRSLMTGSAPCYCLGSAEDELVICNVIV